MFWGVVYLVYLSLGFCRDGAAAAAAVPSYPCALSSSTVRCSLLTVYCPLSTVHCPPLHTHLSRHDVVSLESFTAREAAPIHSIQYTCNCRQVGLMSVCVCVCVCLSCALTRTHALAHGGVKQLPKEGHVNWTICTIWTTAGAVFGR